MGASAALFGLIGAMIAMGIKHRSTLGDHVKSLYIRWAIYGLLFGLLPGIDNAAHIGGLTFGFPGGLGGGFTAVARNRQWSGCGRLPPGFAF